MISTIPTAELRTEVQKLMTGNRTWAFDSSTARAIYTVLKCETENTSVWRADRILTALGRPDLLAILYGG